MKSVGAIFLNKAWEQVPDKLCIYDYIGCNPSKGGLFRKTLDVFSGGIMVKTLDVFCWMSLWQKVMA